jgi:ubiquitin C-terminal hydrolase
MTTRHSSYSSSSSIPTTPDTSSPSSTETFIPNGLMNFGNTCYINATIQCLLHCDAFPKLFINNTINHSCNDNNKPTNAPISSSSSTIASSPNTTLIESISELMVELVLKHHNPPIVFPKKFIQSLHQSFQMRNDGKGRSNALLRIHAQNDLHEFLTLLLDKLNVALSKVHRKRKLPEVSSFFESNEHKNAASTYKHLAHHWYVTNFKELSPLRDLVYGQTITQITCGHCGKHHHTIELFTSVLLPLPTHHRQPGSSAYSIDKALDTYIASEPLSSEDWVCDGCKTKSSVGGSSERKNQNMKCLRFSRLPKILILCVKRFTTDMEKNNEGIHAPENLNMEPYCLSDSISRPPTYQLRAMACHSGNLDSGHYWALCRHFDHAWYKFDDAVVTRVAPPNTSLPGTPRDVYVLFYVRDT